MGASQNSTAALRGSELLVPERVQPEATSGVGAGEDSGMRQRVGWVTSEVPWLSGALVDERVFPYLVQTHRAEVIANGIHILQGKKKGGREDRRRKKEAEKEKRKRKRKEKTKKKKTRKEEKTDIPSDQSSAAITRVSGLACKEAGTSWSLRRGLLSDWRKGEPGRQGRVGMRIACSHSYDSDSLDGQFFRSLIPPFPF